MNPKLSPDEAHLNRLWFETFGQPLPLIGAPEIATTPAPKGVATQR